MMTDWREPFGSSNSRGLEMQGNTRQHQPESDARAALLFIFFCIACIALTGVFLMAYVYWGFQ